MSTRRPVDAAARAWTEEFAAFLSPSAVPPRGQPRHFTADDVRVIALIARMRQRAAAPGGVRGDSRGLGGRGAGGVKFRPQLRHIACHMVSDLANPRAALGELHAFAARIGLKRSWYQPRSSPHYDLSPRYRAAAIRAGAETVASKELVRRCVRRKKVAEGEERQ